MMPTLLHSLPYHPLGRSMCDYINILDVLFVILYPVSHPISSFFKLWPYELYKVYKLCQVYEVKQVYKVCKVWELITLYELYEIYELNEFALEQ